MLKKILSFKKNEGCTFFVFPGSPSLRSPTENSIASLVSAAAIVKAKSESEGEVQMSTGKHFNFSLKF